MWWFLKIFSNWFLKDAPFPFRFIRSTRTLLPVYWPSNSLVEYIALLLYIGINSYIIERRIQSIHIAVYILTYTYYKLLSTADRLSLQGKIWSDVTLTLYESGLRTGVPDIHVKFTLSTGTYSIDGFNAKVKLVVLQQQQNFIKDLNLIKLKHYMFMACNNFLTVSDILDNYLEKTSRNKSTIPPGKYET